MFDPASNIVRLEIGESKARAVRGELSAAGGVNVPAGVLGARLEVDVHVMCGHANRLMNPSRTVKGLQLEVDDVVFNGVAASLALLTNEAKELGALVIDLGAGTTDYAVYSEG